MNKMKSFVKEVVAILKGDDAEALGQKILRQADSAFKTQLATLTGDTIALEDAVENCKESLRLAKINSGELITDRNQYIRTLLSRKNKLIDAEDRLEAHLLTISFLEEEYKSLEM